MTARSSPPARANLQRKPLSKLSPTEWERLCDRCGKCCLRKLIDKKTGETFVTNVICAGFDLKRGKCKQYSSRQKGLHDCQVLTAGNIRRPNWLPSTCAYRLRDQDKPLPGWHHLRSGSRQTVHTSSNSVRGWAISESQIKDLFQHILGPADLLDI